MTDEQASRFSNQVVSLFASIHGNEGPKPVKRMNTTGDMLKKQIKDILDIMSHDKLMKVGENG